MLGVLVPLYALSLGYNAAMMGVVVSSQGVLQFILRMFGGVVSDRYGERGVQWFSFGSVLTGSLIFAASSTLTGLIFGQFLLGAARSVYRTAGSSYASRIGGGTDKVIGWFFGFGSIGLVFGAFLGGALSASLGYKGAFLACSCLGGVTLALSFAMPNLRQEAVKRTVRQAIVPIPGILRNRPLYLGAVCGFAGSMSFALMDSVYAAYFRELGYGDTLIGFLKSLYGLGSLGVGMLFAVALRRVGQKRIFAYTALGLGAATTLSPLSGEAVWALAILLTLAGVGFNVMRILYIVIVTEYSGMEERGLAIAAMGMFWALAQIVVPTLFGALAVAIGAGQSIAIAGLVILATGIATPFLYRMLASR